MAGSLRTLVFAVLVAVAISPVACGVEFEPDLFCWKCEMDAECGSDFVCRKEGQIGHCVPDDLKPGDRTPCDPLTPAE